MYYQFKKFYYTHKKKKKKKKKTYKMISHAKIFVFETIWMNEFIDVFKLLQ